MTLEELKSKCFSMPGHVPPAKLYVFTDEDSDSPWGVHVPIYTKEDNKDDSVEL